MNRADEIELLDTRLREARGMVKDLRQATLDARTAKNELYEAIQDAANAVVDKMIGRAVSDGLDGYRQELREAMAAGVAKVLTEFDNIANLLMTGNTQGRGESLADLVQERVASIQPWDTR